MKNLYTKHKNFYFLLVNILLQMHGLPAEAQLAAYTGAYVGNGLNNRSITGLSFKPDLVLIKCNSYYAQISTSSLPANSTKDMNGGLVQLGLILSLVNGGFTLGSDPKVNENGTTFDYLAVRAEPGVIEFGSYTGNGVDNRNISGTSFRPDMVIIIPENNSEKPHYSTVTMGSDQTTNFLNSGFTANQIQTFNTDGFQVGNDITVNFSGIKYHYVALKHSPGKIFISSYTGNGSDNRMINPPGQGIFTMTKMSGQHALFRNWNMSIDKSHYFKNSASVSSRIKRILTDGFELGTNNEVNQSGSTYHYMQITGIDYPLPIKWLSFDIDIFGGINRLKWEISFEDNYSFFDIERSDDGVHYKAIDRVKAIGNSITSIRYQFDDLNPIQGISYYRIKQVDADQHFNYSAVRKVNRENKQIKKIEIYPNPVLDNVVFINYEIIPDRVYIDVMNTSGKYTDRLVLNKGETKIQLPDNMPPGIYFLILHDKTNVLFRKKIIKVR